MVSSFVGSKKCNEIKDNDLLLSDKAKNKKGWSDTCTLDICMFYTRPPNEYERDRRELKMRSIYEATGWFYFYCPYLYKFICFLIFWGHNKNDWQRISSKCGIAWAKTIKTKRTNNQTNEENIKTKLTHTHTNRIRMEHRVWRARSWSASMSKWASEQSAHWNCISRLTIGTSFEINVLFYLC